jgi:hypothetical protein
LDEMVDTTMPKMFEIHSEGNMPGLRHPDEESSPSKILARRQVRSTENRRVKRTLRSLENSVT